MTIDSVRITTFGEDEPVIYITHLMTFKDIITSDSEKISQV